MKRLEKELERKLVKAVEKAGGLCIKLTSGGGLPDRMCLMPYGRIVFVEVKRQGERPRLLQEIRLEELERLGFNTVVLDEEWQIETFVINPYVDGSKWTRKQVKEQ